MNGDESDRVVPLTGGNASGAVARVGDTVRKPWTSTTGRTVAYLQALRRQGIDLPEPRGRDEQGRLILEYVPGRPGEAEAPLGLGLVRRLGALVRTIHDASARLPADQFPVDPAWEVLLPARLPAGQQLDLLCHNDLAPWNLVIDGDRLVFIDWDGAGPSTRLWDLAYAATACAHLFPDSSASGAQARLAAFVAGYRADAALCAALPTALVVRATAMYELLHSAHASGREPWGAMYVEGHGEHWLRTSTFLADHADAWRAALGSRDVGVDRQPNR